MKNAKRPAGRYLRAFWQLEGENIPPALLQPGLRREQATQGTPPVLLLRACAAYYSPLFPPVWAVCRQRVFFTISTTPAVAASTTAPSSA